MRSAMFEESYALNTSGRRGGVRWLFQFWGKISSGYVIKVK
jgi:hypothetical protein